MTIHRRDPSPRRTTSEAVLSAIAEREGVEEWELQPPLYDAVDPDALDKVTEKSGVEVVFEYTGYTVIVDSNSKITLTPTGGNGTDSLS